MAQMEARLKRQITELEVTLLAHEEENVRVREEAAELREQVGSLEESVENLSARYSPDGPKVLEDISFEIKSGERVGVGMLTCVSFELSSLT